MEPRIKERFNDDILQAAMLRYGIAADRIHLLDGFESFMYEFQRDDGEYILRIGHSLRRNPNLILGEVEWINYLATGGASVAKAILSESGNLVEAVDDGQGEYFLATAFIKAQGQPPWKAGWSPALYEAYGQLVGRMHALTKRYQPPKTDWRRPEWDEDLMLDVETHVPASQMQIIERFRAVMAHLQALPKDSESYGLIHFDAHEGNFFMDAAGRITLFDFDDCCYSWFINDIAIVLFYIAMSKDDPPAFTQQFLPHFFRGYARENHLDAKWLKEIPWFLKLREIDLYALIHRSFDVNHLDDPWCARYMHQRKERIEQDVPFIAFDFEQFEMN